MSQTIYRLNQFYESDSTFIGNFMFCSGVIVNLDEFGYVNQENFCLDYEKQVNIHQNSKLNATLGNRISDISH